MKKRGLIALLTIMMLAMSSVAAFAADGSAFALKSSYPKDGQKNTSMENAGVKLEFNHSISGEKAEANNEKCVSIVDKDGKEVPINVLTQDSADGLMLVLIDTTDKKYTIENNSDYTLIVDKNFMDAEGNTLGEDIEITFRTFNQRFNMMVNMVMMALMFGGIMFFTVRQTMNQKNEDKLSKEKGEAKFNPYREAKRTGKSVEEVIAEEEKRRAKAEKRARRKGMIKDEDEILDVAALLPYVYKVHDPRPIAEVGGKYISGRGKKKQEQTKRQQSKTRQRASHHK